MLCPYDLDRQQRKLLKQLLKEIKTDKRELKMDSTQLIRKYPQHSEKYFGQLSGKQ